MPSVNPTQLSCLSSPAFSPWQVMVARSTSGALRESPCRLKTDTVGAERPNATLCEGSTATCSVSYLVLKLGVILVLFLLLLLLLLLFTLISVWEVVVLYLAGFSLVDGALEVLVPWGPKGDCNAAHEKCCFMCILIAFTLMFITWLNPSTLGFYLSVIDNNLGWQFSAEIRFLMQYFFLVSLMSDILLFCLCNAS